MIDVNDAKSEQDVMDIYHQTFIVEGKWSSVGGICKYRGGHEKKCIVGLFIDDALAYWMDDVSAYFWDNDNGELLEKAFLTLSKVVDDRGFWGEIQNLHDTSCSRSQRERVSIYENFCEENSLESRMETK